MDEYQPKFRNFKQFLHRNNTRLYVESSNCSYDEHSVGDSGETGLKVNSMHDSLFNRYESVKNLFCKVEIHETGSIFI